MKYKLAGICAVLAAMVVSLLAPLFTPENLEPRIHQHREAVKPACTALHSEDVLCSHLPLVVLDTDGVEIPGKPLRQVTNPDGTHTTYYSKAADGADRILAQMKVIDGTGYNHANDAPALESNITIRVRGRSSRYFAKSSYALTLVQEDGSNRNESLLGMKTHHDWVLHGPYLDKTEMRNYLFYNLAGETMDYAPNVRYCEVILNGVYQGLYVLTESITGGQDGSRLPLEVSKKGQTYSGYLVRLDQNHELTETIDTLTGYTFRRKTDLEILYPGPQKLTETMRRSILDDFSAFEKALYSYDYDSDTLGYEAYVDVDSFIDAYLLNEITVNYDFGALSTYLYKGVDGKFRVCVWDFNNSCENYEVELGWRSFQLHNGVWYVMLFKDEDFVKRTIERYQTLRQTIYSTDYLMQYVDGVAAYLGPAIERDRARWEPTYATGGGLLPDPERTPATYAEAADQLKTFLRNRLEWLDENIEALRQYAAESHVKKFSEVAN